MVRPHPAGAQPKLARAAIPATEASAMNFLFGLIVGAGLGIVATLAFAVWSVRGKSGRWGG